MWFTKNDLGDLFHISTKDVYREEAAKLLQSSQSIKSILFLHLWLTGMLVALQQQPKFNQ